MDPSELFPWLFGGSIIVTVIGVIVITVVSLLCTALPFVAIFWYIAKRSKQAKGVREASQAWQMTAGKVIKSRVEVSGGDHTSVSPRVIYEYEVFGQRYQNDQIRAGDQFMRVSSSKSAYGTIDRYPEGAAVTVYYNPAAPQESALER
jgi:hypothetical protein